MSIQIFGLKKINYIYLLSPSFLILTYISLSLFLGQYVVIRQIDFHTTYYDLFVHYSSVKLITIYFLLSGLVVFLSIPVKQENLELIKFQSNKKGLSQGKILLLLGVIFLLSFASFSLRVIGGGDNFIYPVKLGLAIIIVFHTYLLKNRFKYFVYIVLIALFVSLHYESKREIIFLFFLIAFFEILKRSKQLKFRLKEIFIGVFITSCLVYLIVVSSIMRGYGGFNVSSPLDASYHVVEYLQSDYVGKALAINFEISTVYGNSSNAVDYIVKDEVDYLYGSTFLKFLFLPIPRSLFPEKPQSMVNIYTKQFAPDLHAIGSTRPIIIYSEVLWNFSIFGLMFLYFMINFFNRVYLKMIYQIGKRDLKVMTVFYIFMYITIIQFIRGAGFELWLLYALVQLPFTLGVLKLLNLSKG